MGKETKPLLAELFGTFVLVFIGAGTCALHNGGILGAALAHGLAITAVVYMLGGVSGAHVNPAVTFGLAVARKIEWPRAAKYWAAQVMGAVLAALTLKLALADRAALLGATLLAEDVTPMQGLLVEAVLTGILAAAVMVSGVLGKNGNVAGLAIGLTLAACTLAGGSLTGASLNPARTLGPGILSGELEDVWVYLVGPCVGGAVGALLARHLHADRIGQLG